MDYEEIPISEMIWNMGIQLRLPNVWIQKMAKLSSIRILINEMCYGIGFCRTGLNKKEKRTMEGPISQDNSLSFCRSRTLVFLVRCGYVCRR